MKLSKAFKNVLRGKRHDGTPLPKGVWGGLRTDRPTLRATVERQAKNPYHGERILAVNQCFYIADYPTETALFTAVAATMQANTTHWHIGYHDMSHGGDCEYVSPVKFRSPTASDYKGVKMHITYAFDDAALILPEIAKRKVFGNSALDVLTDVQFLSITDNTPLIAWKAWKEGVIGTRFLDKNGGELFTVHGFYLDGQRRAIKLPSSDVWYLIPNSPVALVVIHKTLSK